VHLSFFKIESDLAFDIQSHIDRIKAIPIKICAGDQRLGRDAASVETHTPQLITFDQHDSFAKLRCTYRSGISARPGTDYRNVI